MNNLKAAEEFVVGKHGIGYVSTDFLKYTKGMEFEPALFPTVTKLGEPMNDYEIAEKIKPGICTLGEVLAVLESSSEEYRDGYFNLFYFPNFVVGVRWLGDEWFVSAWKRDSFRWFAGSRVFSPATDHALKPSKPCCAYFALGTFDTRLSELEEWKKRMEKVIKL